MVLEYAIPPAPVLAKDLILLLVDKPLLAADKVDLTGAFPMAYQGDQEEVEMEMEPVVVLLAVLVIHHQYLLHKEIMVAMVAVMVVEAVEAVAAVASLAEVLVDPVVLENLGQSILLFMLVVAVVVVTIILAEAQGLVVVVLADLIAVQITLVPLIKEVVVGATVDMGVIAIRRADLV